MDQLKSVIVVGASAGGLQAISELLQKIPQYLDAAIFVVLHVSVNSSENNLVQYLQKDTSFKCCVARDGDPILVRHVYLAKPDHHLLLKTGTIRVIKSPHENRWRPSIDVLFRSAAAAYNSKVTGIILTGLLDDGTSGMAAIKRCGGICMVQEPAEAQFADMPINVLNRVEVDFRVSVSDMGYILDDLNSKPLKPAAAVPDDIRIEVALSEKMVSGIEELKKIGEYSDYTCPDCGGSLFSIKNDPVKRYRCFTGHVYTTKILLEKQAEMLEDSLWITIRRLEERKSLYQNTSQLVLESEDVPSENGNPNKIQEIEEHIERLKSLIISLSKKEISGSTGYE